MTEKAGVEAPPVGVATRAGLVVRLLLALACLAVPVWVAATRWSALVNGHPAYPAALAAVAVLGVALAVRARHRRARGALRVTGRVLGAVTIVLVLGALVWLRPFAAEPVAVAAASPSPTVDVVNAITTWELQPRGPPSGAGFVFYPGARVDARAYLALLRPLAEQGHLVVVVKPPLDIALLAQGAAGGAVDAHPEVTRWAVGGHSLGGVAAASAAQADPRLDGLVLWAAYPVGDLSGSDVTVASISGDRDGLTTPADIEETRDLLPPDTSFTVVLGAVHAFFGDYGPQPGDGQPTTPREAAQRVIVETTGSFLASVAPARAA